MSNDDRQDFLYHDVWNMILIMYQNSPAILSSLFYQTLFRNKITTTLNDLLLNSSQFDSSHEQEHTFKVILRFLLVCIYKAKYHTMIWHNFWRSIFIFMQLCFHEILKIFIHNSYQFKRVGKKFKEYLVRIWKNMNKNGTSERISPQFIPICTCNSNFLVDLEFLFIPKNCHTPFF